MARLTQVISSQEDNNLAEVAESIADAQEVKARSIRGVLSYVGRSVITYAVTIAATFLLAAFLSPEEFGVFYIVTSVLGLFTFLSDIGLASALIQSKHEPSVADMRTTFTMQQLLSLLILAIVVAMTPYWQNVQHLTGESLWLLYVVAASFLVITFKTIPSVLLTRQLRFDLLALPAVAENLVFYGVTTLLAWQGWGVTSFLWGVLARDFAGITLMYSLQRWPIGLGISRASLKHLLRYGIQFQLNDLLARIKDDFFTIFVVGAWLGHAELGMIAWAKRYTSLPQQFTVNNVTAITFPTYSRIQHDPALLRKAIEKTLYFITLIAFPMLAGMAIFFGPLVTVLPEYNKWQPAVPATIFFAINIAWSTLSTPLTNTLNAIGQVHKTLWLMVMWTVMTWVLTPLMIYFFGFTGVAIASALIGFSSVVTIWITQRVIAFDLWGQVWRQGAASLAMIVVGWMGYSLWVQSLSWFLAGLLICGTVFVGTFLAIGWGSLKKELRSIGLWPLPLKRFQS